MEAHMADLHGVAASRVLSARDCEDVAGEHWWIAGGSGADFRVVGGTAAATEDELRIAPALLRRLGARAGDKLLALPLRP
jgi:arginine/ornithine N-succinyltransferase beta subunit